MANRDYARDAGSLEKGRVTVHVNVLIGATGAPTLRKWSPASRTYATAASGGFAGVLSITRTDVGLYSIRLQDSFQRLLGVKALFSLAGGTSNIVAVANNSTLTNVNSGTAPTVAIACMSSTATVADPDNGCVMDLEIELQNSAAL